MRLFSLTCYCEENFGDDHSARAFRRAFYVALLRVDIMMQIRNAVELNTEQEVNGIAVLRSKLP